MKSLRALAALAILVAAAARAAAASVSVEGTEFRVAADDGSVLSQQAIEGLVLTLGDGSGAERRIRIDSAERAPGDPDGEVMLYGLSERDATGAWRNICLPDREGRRLAFPLQGSFSKDGRYDPTPGRLLITCTGGAEGKCVRSGYKPWGHAKDGTPLLDAYRACVRLVRADYSGDGLGTTRNGQPIDIYDDFGVQAPSNDPAYEFEAGFSPDGAVCVRHARVKENANLESIAASQTRLAGAVGEVCTETFARGRGAILFVRSPP